MNTTKKGDKLEDRVYSILSDLLAEDNFFVSGKNSKIFKKKGYYSRDRDGDIVFDITIETFMPGAKEYSMLTIIECKNLNHKVPVDDVEEFAAKIRQIGENNTKGIIISQKGFQKGALSFGKSNKLGICIVEQKEKLQWISYRKDREAGIISSEIKEKILGKENNESNFGALFRNRTFDNIPDLLIDLGVIDKYYQKSKYIEVKYLSDSQIESNVLELTRHKDFYYRGHLDLNLLSKYLESKYNLKIEFEKVSNKSFLGKLNYENNEIAINEELNDNITKKRFTIAHEIGHFILHRIYSNQLSEINDKEIDVNEFGDTDSNKRMEIQANLFASQLLMPFEQIKPLAEKYFTEERIHKGYLYLDHQSCNQILVMKFLAILHEHFNISTSVAKYRLKNIGLLKDETDNSLKNIMRRNSNA
jgi:Zn-dependent peptidase ImmA (M78 family)